MVKDESFQIKKYVQLQSYVNFRNNQGRQNMLFFQFYFLKTLFYTEINKHLLNSILGKKLNYIFDNHDILAEP